MRARDPARPARRADRHGNANAGPTRLPDRAARCPVSAAYADDRTPRPEILPLQRENLPLEDLAPYPNCVTWALELRTSENGKPGWTKVPKNPLTGTNAKADKPSTWSTVDNVLSRHDRFGYEVAENDPF